jgi:hypothetical protein
MEENKITHIDTLTSVQNTYQRVADAIRKEKFGVVGDCDGDVNTAVKTYKNYPLIVYNTTLECMARKVLSMKEPE